ncbi:MAG TPA: hypothetical protein PKD54_14590 [Pirellulaceae bacterium]|nr:hypothetical protein [Pirellulaceae bacterium]
MIHQGFISGLKRTSVQDLQVFKDDEGISSLRRGLPRQEWGRFARLRLVADDDEVLDWDEGGQWIPGLKRRRRGGSGAAAGDGSLVVAFPRIAPSMITDMLLKQDAKFTPTRGLMRVQSDGQLTPAELPENGNVLLIVHGTFSKGENYVQSFQATETGRQFLNDALQKYTAVYTFNHPTISVSPLTNAVDLQRAVNGTRAEIDILSHSRGGLVTRWWCELFDPHLDRCKNAILVGVPLAGTGLAAPPNIRKTLKLLTNYGNALNRAVGMAATAVPILGLVNTLLTVITSVTSLAASTPLPDALMSMIPGLFGQSRVGNNPELLRLHESQGPSERYAAMYANYQSDQPGWRFWKYFSKGFWADVGADIIFDGPNDLVVDTDSMSYLSENSKIKEGRFLDFGTTGEVHHNNYLDHPQAIDFCRRILNF